MDGPRVAARSTRAGRPLSTSMARDVLTPSRVTGRRTLSVSRRRTGSSRTESLTTAMTTGQQMVLVSSHAVMQTEASRPEARATRLRTVQHLRRSKTGRSSRKPVRGSAASRCPPRASVCLYWGRLPINRRQVSGTRPKECLWMRHTTCMGREHNQVSSHHTRRLAHLSNSPSRRCQCRPPWDCTPRNQRSNFRPYSPCTVSFPSK